MMNETSLHEKANSSVEANDKIYLIHYFPNKPIYTKKFYWKRKMKVLSTKWYNFIVFLLAHVMEGRVYFLHTNITV